MKTPLQLKSISGWQIDCYDLEKLIQEEFQPNYNIVAEMEWHNDMMEQVDVDEQLSEYDVEGYEEFINKTNEFPTGLHLIMYELVKRNRLPGYGTYFINVCW